MKRALIIHGWESNSREHWFQQEKEILEKRGYEVLVPNMPNTMKPKMDEWVKVVEGFSPDENSILVGHSLGAPTVLRFLERYDKKIDKAFLIAGFSTPLNMDYPNAELVDAFVDKVFDWRKIKENTKEIFILNQKNDQWVPKEKGKEIADKTGGEFILVDGDNHFDKMDLDLINKWL